MTMFARLAFAAAPGALLLSGCASFPAHGKMDLAKCEHARQMKSAEASSQHGKDQKASMMANCPMMPGDHAKPADGAAPADEHDHPEKAGGAAGGQ